MIKSINVNSRIIKTFSTEGNYIKKVGEEGKYKVAYDKKPLKYTYQETNEKIVPEEKELTYEEALAKLKEKYHKE